MTVSTFMRIRLAPGHKPLDGLAVQELGLRPNLRDGFGCDAYVGDYEIADVLHAGVDHFAEFRVAERNRQLRLDRYAERRAFVGVESGRNIHCDDR